ncbi:response regulator transcription factor [Natronincola ferrireducens]|uniref:Regulatory protein, luxR family n=1 Tax=Natronincola ferrireducens TaxID=393762 RepID=A0A1G8Z9P8_9FIRM|nr:helix-turn-helix transcriptional regulator [Natronincola ferrireducens]SDK11826.1 regulatory protein, luxR family [Natronincola ferrireducens]
MSTLLEKLEKDQRKLSIISFSLFAGWLLSLPFEGQILYSLMENADKDGALHNTIAMMTHFVGLSITGLFIKKQVAAKLAMITSAIVCLLGSLIFFLPVSILWYISLGAISFFAGIFVASWGFYFKVYSQSQERFKTAADVLIFSNILMIFINGIAVNISAFIGLVIAMLILMGGTLLTFRLEDFSEEISCSKINLEKTSEKIPNSLRPLVTLCLFILVITINSGLMYRVVIPAFAHHQLLTSYYWAIPYIVALFFLRNAKDQVNRGYILYIALAMIGLSYVSFMWLDRSITSYFIINTLMLAAFGVFDLFWWSILGEFFDYSQNPVQVLGIGLSMNVLGITIGGIVGNNLMYYEGLYYKATLVALTIVFVIITLLPILHMQLTRFLKSHVFLFKFANMKENQQQIAMASFREKKQLTDRETEIIELLLKGYTYKGIAENLCISENTMKYHVKNIYQKLSINSKMELIKIFSEEEKTFA